MREAQQLTTAL
jgi:hypothetical protein